VAAVELRLSVDVEAPVVAATARTSADKLFARTPKLETAVGQNLLDRNVPGALDLVGRDQASLPRCRKTSIRGLMM
jgi:hypothetical protein